MKHNKHTTKAFFNVSNGFSIKLNDFLDPVQSKLKMDFAPKVLDAVEVIKNFYIKVVMVFGNDVVRTHGGRNVNNWSKYLISKVKEFLYFCNDMY